MGVALVGWEGSSGRWGVAPTGSERGTVAIVVTVVAPVEWEGGAVTSW